MDGCKEITELILEKRRLLVDKKDFGGSCYPKMPEVLRIKFGNIRSLEFYCSKIRADE